MLNNSYYVITCTFIYYSMVYCNSDDLRHCIREIILVVGVKRNVRLHPEPQTLCGCLRIPAVNLRVRSTYFWYFEKRRNCNIDAPPPPFSSTKNPPNCRVFSLFLFTVLPPKTISWNRYCGHNREFWVSRMVDKNKRNLTDYSVCRSWSVRVSLPSCLYRLLTEH